MKASCVCLLPARNAVEHLPGYFRSVAVFADAVIVLDDGSTDETLDIAASTPLVSDVLRNEPRSGYAGWNDGANRRRLLQAAKKLDPDWVVFLDADERLDEEDGLALAAAMSGDALPGCAYGFQHFRMWDEALADPDFRWIYRMFSGDRRYHLPDIKLHFNPVPLEIPSLAWIRTTIRVRHVGADSIEAVQRRIRKYEEVDPQGHHGGDSAHLSAVPERLAPWQRRADSTPFLYNDIGSDAGVAATR